MFEITLLQFIYRNLYGSKSASCCITGMLAICIHKFLHMSCRANPRRLNNHHHALNLVTSLDFAHVSPMRALPNSLGNGNNGCRKMHVSLRVLSVILHLCTDPIFLYLFIIFKSKENFVHFFEFVVLHASICER